MSIVFTNLDVIPQSGRLLTMPFVPHIIINLFVALKRKFNCGVIYLEPFIVLQIIEIASIIENKRRLTSDIITLNNLFEQNVTPWFKRQS